MKKLLLSALICTAFSASAQEMETTTSDRQNDIMISPIELIASQALNISYERLLNKDSGIGINGIFVFNDNQNSSTLTSQISPYYRIYFGKKYASGFFVEAFAPITTSNDSRLNVPYSPNNYYNNPYYTYEKKTTIGAGIGFGGKWVARRNIIFEVSAGVARRFGNGVYDKVAGKGMLGIGYRF
ncbi:DUF3575 domain-containing protein [Halpernia sp. GG3]